MGVGGKGGMIPYSVDPEKMSVIGDGVIVVDGMRIDTNHSRDEIAGMIRFRPTVEVKPMNGSGG